MTPQEKNSPKIWISVWLLALFSIVFLLFMEWLFQLTKQSSFSSLSFTNSVMVFLLAIFTPCLLMTLLVGAPAVLSLIPLPKFQRICRAGSLLPSCITLACSALLMVDNFTIAVFHHGIRDTRSAFKFLYTAGFVFAFFLLFRILKRRQQAVPARTQRRLVVVCFSVLIVLCASGIIGWRTSRSERATQMLPGPISGPKYNVLILGSDGLSADHMSLYGYGRDTTPFIRTFSQKGLVVQNALTNCRDTLGSLISILSGRLPTETHMIYPPDILRGMDSYRHLPGIFQKSGYHTIQITVRNFADAYEINMRDGFTWVNFRDLSGSWVEKMMELQGQEARLFLQTTRERLTERLMHIFGGPAIHDPYAEVMQLDDDNHQYEGDSERISELKTVISASNRPFFAHVHLMGTHGAYFRVDQRLYSAGQKQNEAWMTDFYDDAVLEFDRHFKEIIDFLQQSGRLDHTIVVLYSDHAIHHGIDAHIPMIFWFPQGRYAGIRAGSVQNIDIAPTVLDFLGLSKPGWMTGDSLLTSTPDDCRPILAARSVQEKEKTEHLQVRQPKAPFYTLGAVAKTICNTQFLLNLETIKVAENPIQQDARTCEACRIPSRGAAAKSLLEHLRQNGYDTQSVESQLPATRPH